MRISSANIGMESARSFCVTERRTRRYDVSTGSNDQNVEKKTAGETLSDYLETMRSRIEEIKNGKPGFNAYSDENAKQMKRIREECINYLLYLFFPDMFGSGYQRSFKPFDTYGSSYDKGMTLSAFTEYYHEETEEMSYSTTGSVVTSDGRSISFDLNLYMSRRFMEYYSEETERIGINLCDPLVINLDGDIPELSDQTFYFDLDSDGIEEEINSLVSGTGFLALDQNEDGIINNGSELFGTSSGDGFKDLAVYDDDGNGFIDEGDSAFDRLKIWAMDEKGTMQLYSLREKGIGAIGLDHADTRFSINSMSDNSVKGILRSTGIFLFEQGNVGTIHQIDLNRHNARVHDPKEVMEAYA